MNFSARFIPHFASISEPLRTLTHKGVSFRFGPKERKAFNMLEESLADASTFVYFNMDAPTRVIADASPVGSWSVLMQRQADNVWKPICYASRSLTKVERRYSRQKKKHWLSCGHAKSSMPTYMVQVLTL